jgi:ATP-binding cassette subfamily F protein uup
VGDYESWRAGRERATVLAAAPEKTAASVVSAVPTKRKLSNKEKQEHTELPARIESLEAAQVALNERLNDPEFYRDAAAVKAAQERLPVLEAEIQGAYARWAELDERV